MNKQQKERIKEILKTLVGVSVNICAILAMCFLLTRGCDSSNKNIFENSKKNSYNNIKER